MPNRRALLTGAWLLFGCGVSATAYADDCGSALQPLSASDVYVSSTLLNDPEDDHAGLGRIFQFDPDLNERGVLELRDTTHLVVGLRVDPDGRLWGFDPWAWITVIIGADGRQASSRRFAERPFATVHFGPDRSLYLPEMLSGDRQPESLSTRHPPLPGYEALFGKGQLHHLSPDGEPLAVLEPEVDGGLSGTMAITHSALAPDGRTLVYVSETGSRLMRYDLHGRVQLPDLRAFEADDRQMHFDLQVLPDGRLLVTMGDRLEMLDADGAVLQSWSLPGFGWSTVAARDEHYAWIGNWLSGRIVRLELGSGEITASVTLDPRSVASIAVHPRAP